MAALDTRPKIQDVNHYGGDTLSIKVTVPPELTDAMPTWNAQIKLTRDSEVVDATFDIITPTVSGGPAYLILPGAICAALVAGTPAATVRNPDGTTRTVSIYKGVYDCQLSALGLDPIRTVVQGSLTIDPDVTRLP